VAGTLNILYSVIPHSAALGKCSKTNFSPRNVINPFQELITREKNLQTIVDCDGTEHTQMIGTNPLLRSIHLKIE